MITKLQLERHQYGPLPVVWVTRIPGRNVWTTQADYLVKTAYGEVFIPLGFEFDLASVPRPLWFLIAPFELSIVAPLVHDYLYRTGGYSGRTVFTRKQADDVFYDLMLIERVPKLRASLAYAAVRIGGGRSFG